MKMIQFIGSRNKTDFILYFSHVLTNIGKRVLVVDATLQELYKHGYTELAENQHLYDFQKIDILCGARNWLEVEELLRSENQQETTTNYDVILIDIDSLETLTNEWPEVDDRFYVGDDEKLNQKRDVNLLHRLFDETDDRRIKRVTFTSSYKLEEGYFNNLMNNRPEWRSLNYIIDPDDFEDILRIQMQHELMIPYKKLNKQYKEVLTEMVSALYEMHTKDIDEAVKPSFFLFKRKKGHTQLAESKA